MRKAILLIAVCFMLTGCTATAILGVVQGITALKGEFDKMKSDTHNQIEANSPLVGPQGQAAIASIMALMIAFLTKSVKDSHNRTTKLKKEVRANGNGHTEEEE